MFCTVSRRHHGRRLIQGRQDLEKWLLPHLFMGRLKETADVDIGSLPNPILVGKLPVRDNTGPLQMNQIALRLRFDEVKHLT